MAYIALALKDLEQIWRSGYSIPSETKANCF